MLDEQSVVRAVLGDEAFNLEYQRGQQMTHEETIAFGLTLA
jgi:hypothetical protein